MNVISELENSNISEKSIKNCAEIFNAHLNKRYYFETIALTMCSLTQLNSKKNVKKEPFENFHPLQLIKLLKLEVKEVEKEFKTEKQVNIQRVLEELGDVAAICAGIIAALRNL